MQNRDISKSGINRRSFIKHSSLLGSAALLAQGHLFSIQAQEAQKKLAVGVVGLGRGMAHVNALLKLGGVEIAYICDVDKRRIASAQKSLSKSVTKKPNAVTDFRKILDDKSVDALFIATCNFTHATMTISACAAGKHVYVEKPGSHNAREGELMVAAARKYRRVVQLGTQRRSYPAIIEGMQQLQEGIIGPVRYARSWYNNSRGSIGRGKQVPAPEELDYALWQGPTPERPYVDNLVHYNWHWRWHWGNGELGNNGPHYLDMARWGLGVDYPIRITHNGGRYHFDDDQETPDTGAVTFDFGAKGVSWDYSSCHPRKSETFGLINFYGDKGTMVFDGNGYTVFDISGKRTQEKTGPGGDHLHIGNFLDCIRTGKKLAADIEEGQKSILLCHLGNIAYRTGRTIHFDPISKKIVGDADAMKYWGREYRPGWEPKV
jgi:predicted dehydrogenase